MSKVVVRTQYFLSGKSVGEKFTNYIAKREGVDKTINTKRSEVFVQYAAERPGVVKLGEHGLFGQEDYVDLKKVSKEIYNHKGIVWTEVVSLRQEDAERLGYDTPEAWRNLVRSKQFEIAYYHKISADNLKWYGAFHKAEGHYHMHLIVFNKNPGGEFISKKNYNQYKDMFTKTIFKDELKQIYDERQSLRDKIIDEVKKTVDGFEINIGEPSAEFAEKLNELKFSLDGYKGKKNYQFLSKDQKEKVDTVVKVVCQDDNLQELYRQWCLVELTRLRYYYKEPEKCFGPLEINKNFQRRIENAVLKSALKNIRQNDLYINKEKANIVFGDIVFNLCKVFDQSIEQDINEGFTKSIVDSKDKAKEYRRDVSMGIHHGI